jgi:DNA repair protein RecO (recombination protein O)
MAEFRSFRAESIVLKHHDWGEADRIVTVFSREQGKLRVVARGVRKIRSRRAGHLEPFTHVMLQLARSSDLPIVTQADTVESFAILREDLEAIGHASYIVELLDKFTYQEGANIALFNLLKRTLERLAAGNVPPALVLRYFEMRLLDLAGFRPELSTCVICGEEIRAENQYFSAAQGGVVCPRPVHVQSGLVPISVDALRFLRHFQRSSFSEATRAQPSKGADREMEMVMQHYITYVLERGLNTPKFIKRLKN